jgi:hypothetical protein
MRSLAHLTTAPSFSKARDCCALSVRIWSGCTPRLRDYCSIQPEKGWDETFTYYYSMHETYEDNSFTSPPLDGPNSGMEVWMLPDRRYHQRGMLQSRLKPSNEIIRASFELQNRSTNHKSFRPPRMGARDSC